MDESIHSSRYSKKAFPGMFELIHQPVPATFTEDKVKLLVDLFLQILRIRLLHLFQELVQLLIDSPLRLLEDPIKSRKDPDLNHKGEASRMEFFSTSETSLSLLIFDP
jgi:hypothetical protein